MKIAVTNSYSFHKGSVLPVQIFITIRQGLPSIDVTGTVGKQIQEGITRLQSSIRLAGYSWPKGRIAIHISPSLEKDSRGLDLPIAQALLQADSQIPTRDTILVGEVDPRGRVRESEGNELLLRIAQKDKKKMIVSVECCTYGFRGMTYIKDLAALKTNLQTSHTLTKKEVQNEEASLFDAIHGQDGAKRALAVALAGSLPMLITGSSGVGKTLLSNAARELMPKLTEDQIIEKFEAYIAAGRHSQKPYHHEVIIPPISASAKEIIVKLGNLKGGYAALAKQGVLFLDELPERGKDVVDLLRQFLEIKPGMMRHTQCIIAAQNTCPCGRYGDRAGSCSCSASELARYQHIFSEPIYQRFSISIQMTRPSQVSTALLKAKLAQNIADARNNQEIVGYATQVKQKFEQYCQQHMLPPRRVEQLRRVMTAIVKLDGKNAVDEVTLEEALTFTYTPMRI